MILVSLSTAPGQQLDAPAAASWDRVAREVLRRYGWLPELTDSVRPYDVQVRIFLERYEQRAAGVGPYGDVRWWKGRRYVRVRGAAAAPPGTSRHGLGLAVDCSGLGGFMGRRYLELMSVQGEHGWSNDVGRSIGEAWHQEYSRSKDRHAGSGGGSTAAPTPAPTPPTSEEDDDMPLNDADLQKITEAVWGHKPTGNSTMRQMVVALKQRVIDGHAPAKPFAEIAGLPALIWGHKPTGVSTVGQLLAGVKQRVVDGHPGTKPLPEVEALRAEVAEIRKTIEGRK